MSIGRLVLRRFNGDEIYLLASAVLLPVEREGKTDLWLEVTTEPEAVQTVPDTAEMGMHPSAEVAVTLDHLDLNALVGQTFLVPLGCTEEAESQLATLCYCEHQEVNENEIQVLARQGDTWHVRWTGVTADVNYYDLSKPDTRVEIEGWFTLSP